MVSSIAGIWYLTVPHTNHHSLVYPEDLKRAILS